MILIKRKYRSSLVFFLFFSAFTFKDAFAFQFKLSQVEYNTWSRFCQTAYAASVIGSNSPLTKNIPEPARLKLKRNSPKYGGPWHYCAAIIWLNRAGNFEAAKKEKQLKAAYKHVISEANFSFTHVRNNDSFKARIALLMAHGYKGLGDYEKTIKLLNQSLALSPSLVGSYSLLYKIHKDSGNSEAAHRILLQGIKATKGRSKELHYHLVFSYLDRKDLVNARKHAQLAIKLGYPKQSLKSELEKYKEP